MPHTVPRTQTDLNKCSKLSWKCTSSSTNVFCSGPRIWRWMGSTLNLNRLLHSGGYSVKGKWWRMDKWTQEPFKGLFFKHLFGFWNSSAPLKKGYKPIRPWIILLKERTIWQQYAFSSWEMPQITMKKVTSFLPARTNSALVANPWTKFLNHTHQRKPTDGVWEGLKEKRLPHVAQPHCSPATICTRWRLGRLCLGKA